MLLHMESPKRLSVPAQLVVAIAQEPHGLQTSAVDAPIKCFSVNGAGHATSPVAIPHKRLPMGGEQVVVAHEEGVHTRAALAWSFVLSTTVFVLHPPASFGGAGAITARSGASEVFRAVHAGPETMMEMALRGHVTELLLSYFVLTVPFEQSGGALIAQPHVHAPAPTCGSDTTSDAV